ncbi:MAG: MFS transporter [Actinobacteria bacterium]|nr:MFS transporter [Actinomycetota bacterium]
MSASLLALYGTGIAIGTVIAGLVLTRLTHKWGRGQLLRRGSFILMGAVVVFTSGLPFYVTMLGPLIGGIAGTFIIIGGNAFLTETQGPAAPTAITESSTCGSALGLLGPVLVGVGTAVITWGWRLGPWLLVGALVVLELIRGRDLEVFDAQTGHADDEPMVEHLQGGAMPRLYWWAGATLVALVAVEFTLTTWGATLMREQGGLGDSAAAAAVASLSVGMLVGRFTGSRLTERISAELLFRISIVIAIIGFTIMWLSTNGLLMLCALASTGLGVGLHWPLGISRAIRASQGRPDRAGALVSIGVGVVGGLAPILLGGASESWGIHLAFVLVLILLGIALVISLRFSVPDPLAESRSPAL